LWSLACGAIDNLRDAHGDSRHLSYDLGVGSEDELPDAAGRKRMGNKEQLIAQKFAPRARIAVAQLDEIDGPVKFRSPFGTLDFPHFLVDLHKRARAQHGIKR